MKKMMAGLALAAMLFSEQGFAQQSGGSSQWGSSVILAGNSGSLSNELQIERFEKRGRRLYAVVNFRDLMMAHAPGMRVSMNQSPTVSSPGLTIGRSSSGSIESGTIQYMDGRYSSSYNNMSLSLSEDHGVIEGSALELRPDNEDGVDLIMRDTTPGLQFYLFEEPAEHLSGGVEYELFDKDVDVDLRSSDVDFGNEGVQGSLSMGSGSTSSSWGTVIYDDEAGRMTTGEPLSFSTTHVVFDSDELVAVPVAITGASCEGVELALDLSSLYGESIRTNNYRHVMPDRSLLNEGVLLPVTITPASTPLASSTMSVSSEGETAFCAISSLVSGRGSKIAILDHLNSLIGPTSSSSVSELQASK